MKQHSEQRAAAPALRRTDRLIRDASAPMARRSQRIAVRVRPRHNEPLHAVIVSGESVIEGMVRNISVSGMALYVPGRSSMQPMKDASVMAVFYLPRSSTDCRMGATVVRQVTLRTGLVIGLRFM